MEMWFSDMHTENVKLSIKIDRQLFSAQSEYQRIDVLDSREFGKILVADGDLMLTEMDEFIYHEMISGAGAGEIRRDSADRRGRGGPSAGGGMQEIFSPDGLQPQ